MVCPWWLCYSFDNPLRRLFHDPNRLLNPYVKPCMTIVDIGCGMGYFTISLAKMVGSGGTIIAVDLQERMLNALEHRARRAGVADRIITKQCALEGLGGDASCDFALAFWMVHEVSDKSRFFGEVFRLLKHEGRLLMVEPRYHVSLRSFERTLTACKGAGFSLQEEPPVALSRAVLMGKR
jgi:ubiquinone/menaquinone biosynthesis C-methylase UbiE